MPEAAPARRPAAAAVATTAGEVAGWEESAEVAVVARRAVEVVEAQVEPRARLPAAAAAPMARRRAGQRLGNFRRSSGQGREFFRSTAGELRIQKNCSSIRSQKKIG